MLSGVMRFGLVCLLHLLAHPFQLERGGPGDVGDSGLVQHKMSSRLDNEMIIRLNPHPHCTWDLLHGREDH